jgi:hypothetical protein
VYPQGSGLTNPAYFGAQLAAIEACTECPALKDLAVNAAASLTAEVATVEAQIALLAPLLIAPTDLPKVITWIGNFINGGLLVTWTNYTAMLTELNTKLSALNAAIAAKKAALGCTGW